MGLMAVQWRSEGEPITAKANLNLFNAAPAADMASPAASGFTVS